MLGLSTSFAPTQVHFFFKLLASIKTQFYHEPIIILCTTVAQAEMKWKERKRRIPNQISTESKKEKIGGKQNNS